MPQYRINSKGYGQISWANPFDKLQPGGVDEIILEPNHVHGIIQIISNPKPVVAGTGACHYDATFRP